MTKKVPIIITALKITLKSGLNNFRRNKQFYTSFAFFYSELLAALHDNSSCIEIKQQDNNIIIVWDFSEHNIDKLINEYKSLHSLRLKTNKKFPASQIKYFLTSEFAVCNLEQLSVHDKAPQFLIESDMIERTQKVLSCLDGVNYPSIMLTHSFYNLLPASIRSFMNTPYYFYHICCYSIKKH